MVLFAGVFTVITTGAGVSADEGAEGTKSIVVLGASYVAGWQPDKPIAGYQIINRGIGGQQSFEMLARFDSDVLMVKPDGIIIWGFINDVFRSDPGRVNEALKRTRDSFVAMVEIAERAGIPLVLATEVTVRGKDNWREVFESLIGRLLKKPSYQDYVNGHVIEVNRWIRDLAASKGLPLLDFEAVLADQWHVRKKEFALSDGSHISAAGYEAITNYFEAQLRAKRVFRIMP